MLDFGTDMDREKNIDENEDLFGNALSGKNETSPDIQKTHTENASEPDTTGVYEEAERETVQNIQNLSAKKETGNRQFSSPAASAAKQNIPPIWENNTKNTVAENFRDYNDDEEEECDEEKSAVSQLLRNARSAAGLSVADVENATQVREKFIIALESGNFKKLPQNVYILAYLRKLCELYDISEEEEETIVKPWRDFKRDIPENLPSSISHDGSNENRKILHQLEIALLAAGALIVIGVLALAIILAVSYFGKDETVDPSFNNTELLELQEKPRLIAPQHPAVRNNRR